MSNLALLTSLRSLFTFLWIHATFSSSKVDYDACEVKRMIRMKFRKKVCFEDRTTYIVLKHEEFYLLTELGKKSSIQAPDSVKDK